MEPSVLWCILSLITATVLFLVGRRNRNRNLRLPPGPPGWPVFGNMFDLGDMPHRTIAGLKDKYGAVLWLRIGAINTMVVQSAAAAEELFKSHDVVFSERTITEAMKAHGFNQGSVALAPYGTYWRVMKRVMTVEMIVGRKISESSHARRRCVDDMLTWIAAEKPTPFGIHLARFVFLASFNVFGNLILSRDLVDPDSEDGAEFFEGMVSLMEWAGHPNIVDLFPIMRRLDPQGIGNKSERDMGKTIHVVSKYIEQRIEERRRGMDSKDYLEVLLDYQGSGGDEPDTISPHQLSILVMEVFFAGSETTSGTIEWAMVELLSNPEAMSKLEAELKEVVGPGPRKVEESDVENLKYLQAVVKETLRLHPPLPFLVPRRAARDTVFMGYDIPENTQVLVNVSAIGRDPLCWQDPDVFRPERFLQGSDIDYKGNHFRLIPFGAGRRICAGIPLAHRMLHFLLASLVHHFQWSVHTSQENILKDRKETMGVAVRKFHPFIAIPTPK